MRKYLLAGVMVLLFAMPLAAAEKGRMKIKLPDGFYMYSSSMETLQDGSERVGFGKYFVVYKRNIYSARDAVKKIGISKLNTLFGGDKKYKILCPMSGGQVGQIYSVMIEDEEEWDYKETFFTKDIKQGPAYVANKYSHTGSAAMCLAVPEAYKEIKKKVYTNISQEEVDKIEKLAKEKLLQLVINRREVTKYTIRETELLEEDILLIDRISYSNEISYVAVQWYIFKTPVDSYVYKALFLARGDKVNLITTNYDEESMDSSMMRICGMPDFDGDGWEELIVEKLYPSEDGPTVYLEIYKIKSNDEWTRINKILTTRRVD